MQRLQIKINWNLSISVIGNTTDSESVILGSSPGWTAGGNNMPLKVDFDHVTLKCSKCSSSIEVQISRRGMTKVSDAIERLFSQAQKRKWQRDPDICPDH